MALGILSSNYEVTSVLEPLLVCYFCILPAYHCIL